MGVVLGLLYALPARSQDIKMTSGLFCNSAEQVEQVLKSDDLASGMKLVNVDRAECALGPIAWIDGPVVSTFTTKDGTITVKEVIIVGISPDGMTMEPVIPMPQFIPFLADVKPAGLSI